ncbi:MAG TPA: DUF4383 domain-containing protein [Candidatus Baltobacteraceae bacterium]|nr:DUF4383 domain-containing protein [Candidatus Baltobacteraceae bacterium]
MSAPTIARIFGMLLLLAGIAGLIPWTAPAAPFEAPVVTLDLAYRTLAGLFPVNIANDVLHLVFGITGVLLARSFGASVGWCRVIGWTYLVLTVLGMIPITSTLFGVAPLYGNNIWLHALFALFALYGGYGRGSREELTTQLPA